ncbi:stage II sporulation protein P [Cohnella caldifontis]|uniref:stage II sporulation protein P n=1 Tax=Cohnella caldifontis TaxID=3027471 RepID=UPI0023EAB6C0|nr:stage II sporulation protein P [Cohnella sp. YIM B05605]
MRTKLSVLVVLSFVISAIFPFASASSQSSLQLYLNGSKLNPPVLPRIVSQTTLVPVRTVSEALGASVAWDPAARSVTIAKHSTVIVLTIGRTSANDGGKSVELDAAPTIASGATLVPVRFVAERFGVSVQWDRTARAVRLWTPGLQSSSALIYHSHNRESYTSLLGVKNPDDAYDAKRNIGLLGDRLASDLEKQGAEVFHAKDDYPSIYGSSFSVGKSYEYSAITVKRLLAAHPRIRYLFDLHRDSSSRDETTATIQGTSYARLYFVIGKENPDWKQNDGLARKLQSLVERKYPGLSRGIAYKGRSLGNGVYNQNLSPRSALIEIGGAYNSLEECYRTVDILADAIAQIMDEGY